MIIIIMNMIVSAIANIIMTVTTVIMVNFPIWQGIMLLIKGKISKQIQELLDNNGIWEIKSVYLLSYYNTNCSIPQTWKRSYGVAGILVGGPRDGLQKGSSSHPSRRHLHWEVNRLENRIITRH